MSPDTTGSVSLELRHIKKDYYVENAPFTAIKDLSVCFPSVGFVSILGESGSGKTTLLNIIGGLDRYTEGDLLVEGKSTKDFKDADWDNFRNKRIGFVFQSYNLIPHMSILQNVELPLQLAGVGAKERAKKAEDVLIRVGLGSMMRKKPNELSGGQMQRVAIARALVNDPEIVLADEPTGALDSETSIQVMDLIKDMAKDRCVIMVTHNEKLADKYSDRIIRMRDGEIIGDTAPLSANGLSPLGEDVYEERGRKTSMSFLTALRSSTQNVLTKKGRTALTAVACSIGIIGVALVLATSNGFSNYIADVETSVASSVPITISPTVYSIKESDEQEYTSKDLYPDDGLLRVYDSSASSMFIAHQNNITQDYIDKLYAMMDDPNNPAYGLVFSIMENHDGLDFHFLAEDGDTGRIRSLNQYQQAGMFSSAVSSVTSLPTSVIHELYGDEEAMEGLYDVIYGKFPTAADEMVLVVDNYNRIDINTLQAIGIIDSNADFEYMDDDQKQIDFSDIVYDGANDEDYKKYKVYTNSDYYLSGGATPEVDSVPCYENVQLNCDTAALLNGDYQTFIESVEFVGDKTEKEIVSYPEPSVTAVYNNDEVYHPTELKIVGVLRPNPDSYLSLMPASLAYTSQLTQLIVKDSEEGQPGHQLAELQSRNWFVPTDAWGYGEGEDRVTLDGLKNLNEGLNLVMKNALKQMAETGSISLDSSVMNDILGNAIIYRPATGSVTNTTSVNSFLSWCSALGSSFNSIDLESLMDESGVLTLFSWLMGDGFFDPSGNPNVADLMAVSNSYSTISSILIFPKTLVDKPTILSYLDSLNEGKMDKDQIIYSDVMSDFTDTIATMIDVISAVLIVFASISLLVSSVMTAIITYVSVVERTKEIGVLRACGARKKDVGRIFEAECVLIGGVAGLIGILMTLLLCIPINLIIDNIFPGNGLGSIASLAWWHGIILVILAILLAFLSGFVPSRIAAKRDPVRCLRSE